MSKGSSLSASLGDLLASSQSGRISASLMATSKELSGGLLSRCFTWLVVSWNTRRNVFRQTTRTVDSKGSMNRALNSALSSGCLLPANNWTCSERKFFCSCLDFSQKLLRICSITSSVNKFSHCRVHLHPPSRTTFATAGTPASSYSK
uniref:(northern house mosquito) hypothetical protein n=1 Tax=Culex pipiens TaxID=7175 RepID=A0A8D8G598_CULPI